MSQRVLPYYFSTLSLVWDQNLALKPPLQPLFFFFTSLQPLHPLPKSRTHASNGVELQSHAALRLAIFEVHQGLTLALELWPRPRGSAARGGTGESVRALSGGTNGLFLLEKTKIFQLIHGEISCIRRPETYPFRTAALTTTGDENIRSSQRLEFTEDFHSSFVLGGAWVPVSSSPWAHFRAFWWQLTLVRFPKTRRPDLSPSCPVHRVSLSVPGRQHTHPGAASLLIESPATTQLPPR